MLLNHSFGQKNSLDSDMNLISAFFSALQSFSSEVTKSSLRTINFENITYHFRTDSRYTNLLYVFMTDREYPRREINCKLKKVASTFFEECSMYLSKFSGDVNL